MLSSRDTRLFHSSSRTFLCPNVSKRLPYIIGIDEVGRGPLAGPVVVCAVMIDAKLRIANYELGRLRDSKQLTEKQREAWAKHLCSHPGVQFALARVSPKRIDEQNISRAANLAAWRAYRRLTAKVQDPNAKFQTKLDGGLFLKNKEHSVALGAQTIVRGDEKVPTISAASIIAKVARDRYMAMLAKRYPGYGLEIHKGYGTLQHRRAIRKLGPSPIHRLTFLRSFGRIKRVPGRPVTSAVNPVRGSVRMSKSMRMQKG